MAKNVNQRVAWTEADILKLKRIYPVSGRAACAKAMPYRSSASIGHMATRLKICRQVGNGGAGGKSPWAAHEVEIMERLYESRGAVALVPMLPGRTASAIKGKARFLGLSFKDDLDAEPDANNPDMDDCVDEADEADAPVVVWVKAEDAPRPQTSAPRSIFDMVPA